MYILFVSDHPSIYIHYCLRDLYNTHNPNHYSINVTFQIRFHLDNLARKHNDTLTPEFLFLKEFRLARCLGCFWLPTLQSSLRGSSLVFHVLVMTFSCAQGECGRLVGVTFYTHRRILSVDKNVLSAGLVMSTGSANHRVSKESCKQLNLTNTTPAIFACFSQITFNVSLEEYHRCPVLCLRRGTLIYAYISEHFKSNI